MSKVLTEEIIPEFKEKVLTNTDGSVKSNNIDWSNCAQAPTIGIPYARIYNDVPRISGCGPMSYDTGGGESITINGTVHTNDNTAIRGWWHAGDSLDDYGKIIHAEMGIVTYSNDSTIRGKIVYRYRHGNFGTSNHGKDWVTLN